MTEVLHCVNGAFICNFGFAPCMDIGSKNLFCNFICLFIKSLGVQVI